MTVEKRATQRAYEQRTKHAAQQKYNKNNIQRVVINLNQKTDAEIIKHLEQQPNKQGYLKSLVLKDIQDVNEDVNKYVFKRYVPSGHRIILQNGFLNALKNNKR